MSLLKRFWFEFDISKDDLHRYSSYSGLKMGCGVTAFSYEDALVVLRERRFKKDPLPSIRNVIEEIDVSTLDPDHVLPNIGVPIWRGIWFPRS
jgi:hypothetical protein